MIDDEKTLREKIDALVTKLPAGLVYSLLSEIEHMDLQPPERVRMVRDYVIEHLNRQRPNRSRRLFTTLFESFLIDDDALFHAGQPIAFAIQRADVGALWDTLSREAFPLLAVQCQETLDLMARGELLERALRTPAALELREQMRDAAVRFLDRAFANRKQLEGFVAELTRNRTRRSKLLSAHLNRSPPVTGQTLQSVLTILKLGPDDLAEIADRLLAYTPTPGLSADETEHRADQLADAGNALVLTGGGEELAALLELSVLNVRRDYLTVGALLRRRELEVLRSDPLANGLIGHFLGVCRAFTAILMGVLRLNDRVAGAIIRPTSRDRARLDQLLDRLAQLVEAVANSGLRGDRLMEPQFQLAWDAASKTVNTRVAAVALERASLAASARRQAASDHADVIWLVGLVQRWHDVSTAFGIDAFDLVKWRETLLDELHANTDKAMRFEDAESLDERMEQLLRIDGLCRVFGQHVTAWIPPSSFNMTRLVMHRLGNATPLTADERVLVEATLDHVRDELGRSRYWKSHELVSMMELAEQRLGTPDKPPRGRAPQKKS